MRHLSPTRYSREQVFAVEAVPITARRHVITGGDRPHDHDFMEIQLILGGEGRHQTIQGVEPVGRGDVFVLRPGTWHAYRGCEALEVTVCCFGAELLRRELAWLLAEPGLSRLLWREPLEAGRRGLVRLKLDESSLIPCREHLGALADLDPLDAIATRPERIARLVLALASLARALKPEDQDATPRPSPHPAVLAAVRLLEESPDRNWRLSELARQVHAERSYLVRLFKRDTGLSPMAYLARLRAEQAARLLLRTDLPVGRVGRLVGWEDPNYFARRFRAHFGVSASGYRMRFAPRTDPADVADPPGPPGRR